MGAQKIEFLGYFDIFTSVLERCQSGFSGWNAKRVLNKNPGEHDGTFLTEASPSYGEVPEWSNGAHC